jgi:hypothetical protein
LAWVNTTSLKGYLLEFFLVAEFYTSATTTTKKPKGTKGTKEFFGEKNSSKVTIF